MNKQTKLALSALVALSAVHAPSFATSVVAPAPTAVPTTKATTCAAGSTAPDCAVDITGKLNVRVDGYINDKMRGTVVQVSTGDKISNVSLKNLDIKANGKLEVSSLAVGNNLSVSVDSAVANRSFSGLNNVLQSSKGDKIATVNINLTDKSAPGEVKLDAIAVGNNAALDGLSLASTGSLVAAQCDVGDSIAKINFSKDPASMVASAVAVGNNLSIRLK